MHALPMAPGAFDIIWCPPWSYEQIPGRARRIAWLRELSKRLRPRGAIVMMTGARRDRGPRRAAVDAVRWIAGRASGGRFTTEPGDRLIRHLSLASDAAQPCFFHVFQSADEVRREIVAAGLVPTADVSGAWIVSASV